MVSAGPFIQFLQIITETGNARHAELRLAAVAAHPFIQLVQIVVETRNVGHPKPPSAVTAPAASRAPWGRRKPSARHPVLRLRQTSPMTSKPARSATQQATRYVNGCFAANARPGPK